MKVTYDSQADALYVEFRHGKSVDTDEISPGVIADFDQDGNVIGIEILVASQRVDFPQKVEHEVFLPSFIAKDGSLSKL